MKFVCATKHRGPHTLRVISKCLWVMFLGGDDSDGDAEGREGREQHKFKAAFSSAEGQLQQAVFPPPWHSLSLSLPESPSVHPENLKF